MGDTRIYAVVQEQEGRKVHLRGNAEVETSEMLLQADEIDYDRDTTEALARGNVRFQHFANGEKINSDHVEYNVDEQTGKFYDVSGTSPAKIDARPGVLTTSNPFYFQGKWAERLKDKYILHDGLITDCTVPNAWWVLRGPTFDVIPNNRAIAYRSIMWMRGVPIFYLPAFYKSLKKNPRKSGFLTPNIGNSSRRGKMIGIGYYWAINRSYDLQYLNQYFTERGFAHHVDFRGKVNQKTDFDFTLYGVNDRGVKIGDTIEKQGGFLASLGGRSDLGHGWYARGELNYLSSFTFRQNFTESFHEAVFAESRSIGYLTKHWSTFGVNIVADRDEVFQISTANSEDHVIVRKLPEVQFLSREHRIWENFPLWVSLDSSAGFMRREQPLFATRQFVDRVDFAPRVMTAAYWKGFSIVPAFAVRETQYGSTFTGTNATGADLVRSSRELNVDIGMPSLSRIFDAPEWMKGYKKLKHVIEPRASYRDIRGIDNFGKIIRFDSTDVYSNTQELEVSVTNRLYAKRADGNVDEVLTWQVSQRRFFDPTFGGAVVAGQRNVVMSSADMTGYAFLDGPRNYSPVVSVLRVNYKVGAEWRSDYDPLRGHLVNSSLNAYWGGDNYFLSLGHNQVHSDPVLATASNQFNGSFRLGKENRRGWNTGATMLYDYKQQRLTWMNTQVTYNSDCCGFSVQYRRFSFGTRNENQFRVAFALSNIGTFGTLKRQERVF